MEGWDVMMADLDEEDPKGRGTGKRRKSTIDKVEIGEKDEEVKEVKKRRKRKGTVGSEMGESVVSTETGDSESVAASGRGKRVSRRGSGLGRGRGRGRGRGKGKGSMSEVTVDGAEAGLNQD